MLQTQNILCKWRRTLPTVCHHQSKTNSLTQRWQLSNFVAILANLLQVLAKNPELTKKFGLHREKYEVKRITCHFLQLCPEIEGTLLKRKNSLSCIKMLQLLLKLKHSVIFFSVESWIDSSKVQVIPYMVLLNSAFKCLR